jgi:hypothetical protein
MYMGYRHYDRVGLPPLFPFGHGLSYTTFEYGRPSLSSRVLADGDGGAIELVVGVSNVGDVKGLETVQVYVRDEKSRLPRPEKELVAFEKVELEAGETKHLRIGIDKYAVGYFDTAINRWVAEEGTFRVLVAASAADVKYVPPPFCFCLLLLSVEGRLLTWVVLLRLGMMSRLRLRSRLHGCFKVGFGWLVVGRVAVIFGWMGVIDRRKCAGRSEMELGHCHSTMQFSNKDRNTTIRCERSRPSSGSIYKFDAMWWC